MGFLSDLFGSTSTTNSSSNTNTSGTSSGTMSGSTTATFSPQLQQMMNQLLSYSSNSMNNPQAMFAPIQNAGLQAINSSYAAVPGQVAAQMAARGYGSSGSAGQAMYNANLSRANAVSGFQGNLADQEINQENAGASLGEQLLNTGKGTSVTGTTSGTTSADSSTNTNSTTTTSGLGQILQSLSSLLMVGTGAASLFSGGGGGSTGGSAGGVNPGPSEEATPSVPSFDSGGNGWYENGEAY
jgi:hypothetical protein